LAITWDFIENNKVKQIRDREIIEVFENTFMNNDNTKKERKIKVHIHNSILNKI